MKEFLESVGFCVIMVVLIALYCAATPDQYTGESDYAEQAYAEGK